MTYFNKCPVETIYKIIIYIYSLITSVQTELSRYADNISEGNKKRFCLQARKGISFYEFCNSFCLPLLVSALLAAVEFGTCWKWPNLCFRVSSFGNPIGVVSAPVAFWIVAQSGNCVHAWVWLASIGPQFLVWIQEVVVSCFGSQYTWTWGRLIRPLSRCIPSGFTILMMIIFAEK